MKGLVIGLLGIAAAAPAVAEPPAAGDTCALKTAVKMTAKKTGGAKTRLNARTQVVVLGRGGGQARKRIADAARPIGDYHLHRMRGPLLRQQRAHVHGEDSADDAER